jgi:hypothetical protein
LFCVTLPFLRKTTTFPDKKQKDHCFPVHMTRDQTPRLLYRLA